MCMHECMHEFMPKSSLPYKSPLLHVVKTGTKDEEHNAMSPPGGLVQAETCFGTALSASRLLQQALQLASALELLNIQVRPQALTFSVVDTQRSVQRRGPSKPA